MSKTRVAVVGAGAVGGYIGGKLAQAGHDVRMIDGWVAHVEQIRRHGLVIAEPGKTETVRVQAMHLCDVQALIRSPIEVALVCTKSYDSAWAAMMIRPYLAASACVVSVQNGINEEEIAAVVGWERTLGCIASTISVATPSAGHVSRMRTPGGSDYTVFRVGEVHGRHTPRAARLVELLSAVDSAKVTTNLWGERWSKLVTNSMHHGILGATGISDHALMQDPATRKLATRCAAEAIAVALALGHPLEPILRMPAELWLRAAHGEQAAASELELGWKHWMERSKEPHYGSIGQDMAKGRRTEIDYICGHVVAKGAQLGVATPMQAALLALVKRVERGEIERRIDNIKPLLEQL